MATTSQPTNTFPIQKNSYAAFDAISLRNLIIERLNEQGIFTDQNYLGSNLAAIIDIVSYSFNTLMFYLNRTSTESMFSESQLYENINRIVKILDYKPIGYQTSTLTFQCSAINFNQGIYTIPRYSYLNLGDVNFSFNEDINFKITQRGLGVQPLSDLSNKKIMFQGIYRETPIHTAAGDENETVTINNNDNSLIDHFNIDVYVFETDRNTWIQYKSVTNLFSEPSFARSFEKRLNSNATYDIMFGDGINGRKLETGEKVLVFYLQSSGEQGVVGPGQMNGAQKLVYSSTNFSSILSNTSEGARYINGTEFNNLYFSNIVGSTVPKDIESADSIRNNAPSNFKSQYRLVTKEDYETFIKINHGNFISDVKVFSNWDYTGKYLKYFNDIQVSPTTYRQILLNQILYADSCNFNNLYICAVPKISQLSSLKYLLPAQKEILLSDIQPLKTVTTELTFLDPLVKQMSFGVKSFNFDVDMFDRDFCVLEIVKLSSSKRSNHSILNEVVSILFSYFDPTKAQLGGSHNHSELTAKILAIQGVDRIVTRRLDTNETYEGLSLFYWNPTFPTLDKAVVTNNINFKDFEIVYFENLSDISNKIQVIETTSFV
jgi:hypothetical protein